MKNLVAVFFAMLSLNAFSQIPDYVPSDGLAGWWEFDGGFDDRSGNGNHGIAEGRSPPVLSADRHGDDDSALFLTGGGSGIDGGGSDEFGFKALPGGARLTTPPGPYRSIHTNFNIWTPPYARSLAANEVTIWRRALGDNVVEEDACSVRCIQD